MPILKMTKDGQIVEVDARFNGARGIGRLPELVDSDDVTSLSLTGQEKIQKDREALRKLQALDKANKIKAYQKNVARDKMREAVRDKIAEKQFQIKKQARYRAELNKNMVYLKAKKNSFSNSPMSGVGGFGHTPDGRQPILSKPAVDWDPILQAPYAFGGMGEIVSSGNFKNTTDVGLNSKQSAINYGDFGERVFEAPGWGHDTVFGLGDDYVEKMPVGEIEPYTKASPPPPPPAPKAGATAPPPPPPPTGISMSSTANTSTSQYAKDDKGILIYNFIDITEETFNNLSYEQILSLISDVKNKLTVYSNEYELSAPIHNVIPKNVTINESIWRSFSPKTRLNYLTPNIRIIVTGYSGKLPIVDFNSLSVKSSLASNQATDDVVYMATPEDKVEYVKTAEEQVEYLTTPQKEQIVEEIAKSTAQNVADMQYFNASQTAQKMAASGGLMQMIQEFLFGKQQAPYQHPMMKQGLVKGKNKA